MKNWFSQFLAQTTKQGRNAVSEKPVQPQGSESQMRAASRISTLFISAIVISLPIYFYWAVKMGAWQVYAIIAGLIVAGAFVGFGISLVRRNRVELAMELMIANACLLIPFIVGLISGVGIVLAATQFLIVLAIAGASLSGPRVTRALLVGFAFSIVTLLIDLTAKWSRLSVPGLQSTIPLIAVILVILLGFLVARQFRNYSLRSKLVVAFVAIALVSIGAVGYVSIQNAKAGFNEELGANFNELASRMARETSDSILGNKIALDGLVLNKFVQDSVEEANQAGTSDLAVMNSLDEQWVAATDNDPLIKQILANETAGELRELQDRLPQYAELFVTDKYGAIIASTDRTSDYYQADEEWWQSAWNDGAGDVFISQPEFDESAGIYAIDIALPIPAHNRSDFIGVLRATVNINELTSLLSAGQFGQTGQAIILFPNNQFLTKEIGTGLGTLEPEIISEISGINGAYAQFAYDGTPSLVSKSPVVSSRSGGDSDVIGKLGWTIVIHQDLDEANQPITDATRGIMVLSIGVLIAAGLLALFVGGQFAKPIENLTFVAAQIAAGDLFAKADDSAQDEIGTLATTFNQMTSQLRETLAGLEQRVADRTKALATSTEVSRRLSTILDQGQLVTEVVEQVQSAFNYYHAHIYLLDESSGELVMAGGTGEAGQTMLARGHKISKGKGLVGRAAETNVPVLVSDTSKDPDWLPNPLLTETKSEVAVPISIGDQVLGVLDVQHNVTDGLKQEDTDVLQSISNQVAVALQNIRQYENTQKIAADMGVVANVGIATSTITESGHLLQEVVDLSKKSFNLYHAHIYLLNEAGDALELTAGAGDVGKQMVSEKRSIPLDSEQSLVARAARTQTGVVVNDVTAAPDFLPNPLLPDTRSEMAVPMIVAGKAIGVLDVQSEIANRFTDVDVSIQTTLASQVSVALQNARSFSQAQRLAQRETAVNLITQKIQGTTRIEEALQIAARELGHALGMKQTLVTLESNASAGDGKSN